MQTGTKPHVLVLGSNFAGLGSAQKIREYAGDSVDITVIDRKDYLLFVPNIPTDVVENRDPSLHQRMQLRPVLAGDDIAFVQGAVKHVDIERRTVDFLPSERPGAECEVLHYDYLVIAMGAHLAYDRIPGFAEHGHTVSDLFHGEQQHVSIARALANQPLVILADEPTAPLDSERALAVMRILDQMATQYQTAIIVVTHDEKIIPTFKRNYHIRDGRTVEEAGEGRVLQ